MDILEITSTLPPYQCDPSPNDLFFIDQNGCIRKFINNTVSRNSLMANSTLQAVIHSKKVFTREIIFSLHVETSQPLAKSCKPHDPLSDRRPVVGNGS